MKIDFDVIRWRFLFAGFVVLFFLIGAARHGIRLYKHYHLSHIHQDKQEEQKR